MQDRDGVFDLEYAKQNKEKYDKNFQAIDWSYSKKKKDPEECEDCQEKEEKKCPLHYQEPVLP